MQRALVITGASRGIGHATARHFLQQDYRVINLSRTASSLEGISQIITDLSDPNWLSACSEQILSLTDGCEQIALIHCAALLHKDCVNTVSAKSLQDVMQIGVIAPVQLNQLLLPQMKAGSSIIYVGSTLSEKAVPNAFSYVVSKHGVIGAMRSTCQDLAGTGVHTACVCPGFTDTEMLRTHVGESEEVLSAIAEGVTFKRLADPEEIANTIYFCVANPVINGAIIHANLGQIES